MGEFDSCEKVWAVLADDITEAAEAGSDDDAAASVGTGRDADEGPDDDGA